MLSIFSDSVQAAHSYLETWVKTIQGPRSMHTVSPPDDETRKVLAYNWDIVLQHEKEASDVILKRLARTTNEVQGLMNGVRQPIQIIQTTRAYESNKKTAIQRAVGDRSSEEQAA